MLEAVCVLVWITQVYIQVNFCGHLRIADFTVGLLWLSKNGSVRKMEEGQRKTGNTEKKH